MVIRFDQSCLPIDLHHGAWGVMVLLATTQALAITQTVALIFGGRYRAHVSVAKDR